MPLASTTLPDVELVELARSGDRSAFDELLRRHDTRMRALAFKLMADRHRMDDALQEAYLKAYRALPRFRPGSDFGTWLYRITYNACIDELRKRKRSPLSTEDPVDPVSGRPGPERVVSASETVRGALADLPVDQRVTVVLVDGEGFDHREAAKILGVAPGTIASRLHRARARAPPHPRRGGAMTADETGDRTTRGPDPDLEPDAVVRTALQLLPIPAHGDEFWERLEAALDAEPPLEMPVEPGQRLLVASQPQDPAAASASGLVLELQPDHSLAVVPPAFRRTSNAVLVAVAAAAVVIVGIAGSTLLEEREATTSSGPAPSAALETLMSDAQSDGATVTTISAAHQDASSDAVLAWVDDLGHGDADAAWAAMGDSSQAHFGSQAEFESLMTDLAEGYGAWSAADPADVQVTPVSTDDEGTIAVVTLIGTVQQEGTTQERADAFPVRIVDGDVVLEPFASAGELEVVIPEPAGDEGIGLRAGGHRRGAGLRAARRRRGPRAPDGRRRHRDLRRGRRHRAQRPRPVPRPAVRLPARGRVRGGPPHGHDRVPRSRRRLDHGRVGPFRGCVEPAENPETSAILDPRSRLH